MKERSHDNSAAEEGALKDAYVVTKRNKSLGCNCDKCMYSSVETEYHINCHLKHKQHINHLSVCESFKKDSND